MRRMNEGHVDQVGSLNLNYVRTYKESSVDLPPVIKSIYVKSAFDGQCDGGFYYATFPVDPYLRRRLQNSKKHYAQFERRSHKEYFNQLKVQLPFRNTKPKCSQVGMNN